MDVRSERFLEPHRRAWKFLDLPRSVDRSSSEPEPAPARSEWLILDRNVHRSSSRSEFSEGDGTVSATAYTCTGRPVSASIRVADPPALSRLYLYCPRWVDLPGILMPEVITSDKHSILFEVYSPFEDHQPGGFYELCAPIDYFVYSASSSPPSLTRLPPCFIGGVSNPRDDVYFKPYQNRQLRIMMERDMGLLCHGDEFTVADLTTRFSHKIELCLLRHRHGGSPEQTQWRIKDLPITRDMVPAGLNIVKWQTDAVLPLKDRYLCWIDYYQGMICIDVLHDENQGHINFFPLPKGALQSPRPYVDTDMPSTDPGRCASITPSGMIKFVCITKPARSKRRSDPRHAFTIRTWTLVRESHMKWVEDGVMEAGEFWDLCAGQRPPRVVPKYPVVSLVDPTVICFLMKEKQQNDPIYWLFEVNMENRVLQSTAVYIEEEEEPNSEPIGSIYCGEDYFIPSQFTAYLSNEDIKSRELSHMMQKEKLLRIEALE